MAKVKEIECSIYKKNIEIFLGSYNDMLEWVKHEFKNPVYSDFIKGLEESAPGGAADCHYAESYIIVRLPCFPRTAEEFSYMTHELLHAVFFILTDCSVEFNVDSPNEAYTYLLEWLTKEVLEKKGYVSIKKKAKHKGK